MDSIYRYNLSVAWDISTATPINTLDISSSDTSPTDLFFSPDGLKLFVSGQISDSVKGYSLSTAWDITTATSDGKVALIAALNPLGLCFKPDGLKMYVSCTNTVYQYSLSTSWDVSTAALETSYSVASSTTPAEGQIQAIRFSPDGSIMFVAGSTYDSIYQFSLFTNWDVSTASPVDYIKYFVYAKETTPTGLEFKPDGSNFFVIGSNSDSIHQYSINP